MGGRELAVLPEVEAQAQPEPSMDGRGMVRCAWEATYTIDVEADWVSGLYVVRLETVYDDVSQPSEDSYITFVVRDDTRTGHVLMQTAVNTYAAYDLWGGKSLYADAATGSFDARGFAVSFDRPYLRCRLGTADAVGHQARWLERSGYDVSYATNHDLDRGADSLLAAGRDHQCRSR